MDNRLKRFVYWEYDEFKKANNRLCTFSSPIIFHYSDILQIAMKWSSVMGFIRIAPKNSTRNFLRMEINQ